MADQRAPSGGGKGNPGNFANDRAKARNAGHIGGMHQGRENNPGNFANDRQKAAEAGRKGGQHSHGGQANKAASAEANQGQGKPDQKA